jgi:tetratricopeptide (TPR) repeat protein
MSPEHARADAAAISVSSDVYCLSVILYELLTERLPYELNSQVPHASLRTICEQRPERPRKFNRRIRGELETILLKGLEKEPERRYPSVAALADDIRRFLLREPITARRPSAAYRLRKLISRNKTTAALVSVIFCLATGLGAWITSIYAEARLIQERGFGAITGIEAAALLSESAERNWAEDKLQLAETQCHRALETLRQVQAPESNKVLLNTKILLGRILARKGRINDAEPMLRKALQAYAEYYPGQKGLIAEAKSALGECLIKPGTFVQAELLLVESHANIRAYRGPDHRRTKEARKALFDLYTAWGKLDKAREYGTVSPSRSPQSRSPAP